MLEESAWDAGFAERTSMFEPLAAAAVELGALRDWPDVADLNSLLDPSLSRPVNASGVPIRFIEYQSAEHGTPYELGIFRTGRIPTRPRNWHDLLNALVWATFPGAKAALNARHCTARAVRPTGRNRGPVEDALTGFDESGVAVACADASLAALLLGFRWKELFWFRRREVIENMRFMLFGHGLYEQALRPFRGLTGKGIVIPVLDSFFRTPLKQQVNELDGKLTAFIREPGSLVSPRQLAPIPLLGVPGWWPPNERPGFYDDAGYFRPGRRGRHP